MDASIWPAPLASFCDAVAGTTPAPAAVAAASVTATLGLSLLIKVLEITGKRRSFAGDSQKLKALIEAARRESEKLKAAADEDIAAVRKFVGSSNTADARDAIEVPMRAARSAVGGLALCTQAVGVVPQGLLEADLGAAALLLSAATRAILLSVEVNCTKEPDSYRTAILTERRDLEEKAIGLCDLSAFARIPSA